MRMTKDIRHHCFLYICFFVLTLVLVACGGAASSGPAKPGNGSTSTPGSSTPGSGNGTANGCPSDAAVASTSGAANVITVNATQINQTIVAHNGDTIEIRLPFGHKWTGPTTSQGILQIQTPAGYASKTGDVCIWRFTAKGTGSAQLVFHSQALCQAGEVCPMYITTMPFNFAVK